MRQKEAFIATLHLACNRGWDGESFICNTPAPEFLHAAHARDMLERWGDDFSPAKQGRWLGWLQGVVCALGFLSLEDCKQINLAHSDDTPAEPAQ